VSQCFGGENFGWPNYEGPAQLVTSCPVQSAYTPPIAHYDRTLFTASIISATLYRPTPGGIYNFPVEYHSDYFYADYYQGFLRRIEETAGVWAPAPQVPGQPNANDWGTSIANVSDWAVGPDGGLYYCKQFSSPSIRRIVYTANQGGVGDDVKNRPPIVAVSPNPFSPGRGAARIQLHLESPAAVEIGVYDATGRNVASILAPESEASPRIVTWDGNGKDGQPLHSGIYFLKVVGRGIEGTARVVIAGR
jgi:hypothetical protein